MTRTEDRLIAALESAAAAVPVEVMRPLVAPEQGQPDRGRLNRRRQATRAPARRAWLTAVTAVASIAAVTSLIVANNHQPGPLAIHTVAYIGGSEPHVPAFFLDAGNIRPYDQIRVISLAAGKVTSTERYPAGEDDITFAAEQPQTGNFVAAFIGNRSGGLQLYRFRITGTGKITPLIRIKNILIKQQPTAVTVLALSPDGSRLALAVTSNDLTVNKIVLLNLHNGKRQTWTDKLTYKNHFPQITSAAWTEDGRALVFASHICRLNLRPCFWEFRTLVKAGSGLKAGPVLLRQNGMESPIKAPQLSPDARSVIEIRPGPGSDTSLISINLKTDARTILHRWRTAGTFQVGPNLGNFLFVARQLHPASDKWRLIGWVNGEGFHPLKISADI